jgi:RNA polymerase sigma-70 factor (ECF subfamily)
MADTPDKPDAGDALDALGTSTEPDVWAEAVDRAHAAWPAEWVPAGTFIEHLRVQLPADRESGRGLAALAIEDLYLALACALGVPAAVEAFARTALAEVGAHVARFDRSPAFHDEVRQALAARLLVAAPGATPVIADYAGRAPLSAWVRIAAIRTALNLRRGRAGEVERAAEREIGELAGADDLELEVIRRRYRPAFESAISRALAALSVRDRTLLRLRLVDGAEVDRIAAMYSVHRTTVTRWLADSRAALLAETRRILTAELGATPSELDSLAGLVRSQLHVSLVRLLREP